MKPEAAINIPGGQLVLHKRAYKHGDLFEVLEYRGETLIKQHLFPVSESLTGTLRYMKELARELKARRK